MNLIAMTQDGKELTIPIKTEEARLDGSPINAKSVLESIVDEIGITYSGLLLLAEQFGQLILVYSVFFHWPKQPKPSWLRCFVLSD